MEHVIDSMRSFKEELLSVKSRIPSIRESMKLIRELEYVRERDSKFREREIMDTLRMTSEIIKSNSLLVGNIHVSTYGDIANAMGTRNENEGDIMDKFPEVEEEECQVYVEEKRNFCEKGIGSLGEEKRSVKSECESDFNPKVNVFKGYAGNSMQNILLDEVGGEKFNGGSGIHKKTLTTVSIDNISEKEKFLESILNTIGGGLQVCSNVQGITNIVKTEDLKMMSAQELEDCENDVHGFLWCI